MMDTICYGFVFAVKKKKEEKYPYIFHNTIKEVHTISYIHQLDLTPMLLHTHIYIYVGIAKMI